MVLRIRRAWAERVVEVYQRKRNIYLPQTLRQNQNFPKSLHAALFSVSRAVNAATPLNSLQGKKKQLLDEGLLQKQHFLPFVLAAAVFGS